ncbi:MAG: radical SAM protein [Desulfobacterales bacterium]|nr:radical SAM protein [Desulfobacterales bacterium]
MQYKHIFGPVLSRRLGISLGVDLVVHKICSLDCIYCECGKTTDLTAAQNEIVRFADIKTELDHFWMNNRDPDYITFSGSGEPTLNPCLGRVISYIKEKKPDIKVAVLTNATLFDHPDVRSALLNADRVVPSLDAAGEPAFFRINRPHRDIDLSEMIAGIQTFAGEYTGELYLEIFILPGINDRPSDLEPLKQAVHKIGPDRVQINTLDRPGTRSRLRPATQAELEKVVQFLEYPSTEIIARVDESIRSVLHGKELSAAIFETVHRRPSTLKDLLQTLGSPLEEIEDCLDQLERENKISSVSRERGIFFQTVKKPDTDPAQSLKPAKKPTGNNRPGKQLDKNPADNNPDK